MDDARKDIIDKLRANMFDGTHGGRVTMDVETLLTEVADILVEDQEPAPNEDGLEGAQIERYEALVDFVGHDKALADARNWPVTERD